MQVPFNTEARSMSLQEARSLYFDRGEVPEALLDRNVLRSWERCRQAGLDPAFKGTRDPDMRAVTEARERNRTLLSHAQPVLEHLFEQIRNSHSMVILADAQGMLIQSYGDPDFLSRAEQVALRPGASWNEFDRGTNAVGTALAERNAVNVFGSEHFFESNAFLTCSAAPILDAQGRLIGALDISSDYRAYQRHSLGLVKMSSRIIEKRIFEAEFAHQGLLSFHSRPDHVGSLCEALLAIGPDGDLLGADQAALDLLGMRREDLPRRHYTMLFDVPLGTLVGKLAAAEAGPRETPVRFSEGALQAIEAYAWPGNIRQLFNAIRVAIALLDEGETLIGETHLPEELFEGPIGIVPPQAPAISRPGAHDPWAAAPLDGNLEEMGRQVALRTLEAAGGNISAAARQLGISRNTLYRKLGRM